MRPPIGPCWRADFPQTSEPAGATCHETGPPGSLAEKSSGSSLAPARPADEPSGRKSNLRPAHATAPARMAVTEAKKNRRVRLFEVSEVSGNVRVGALFKHNGHVIGPHWEDYAVVTRTA